MKKVIVGGFICGALAVVVFHQGTIFLLFHNFATLKALGVPDFFKPGAAPYNVRSVPPLGIPQVLNLAFWGGVWGILLAAIIRFGRVPDLLVGFLVGAVVCTLAGFTVFAAMRGQPMLTANAQTWMRVMLFNGAWGWGAALLMRPAAVARG